MARTMTAKKPTPAPTAVTTGGVPGGLQALRNLLDMYGRPASEMSLKERAEAITGYELKQRIEALVRGITGQKINHIYAGSGAATAPGMMLLPRIAGTMLFSPREVKIILGYTAHELAHQLHTDFGLVASIFEDLEKPTTREQQVKEFWNGIEDYRIERESRKRYPGFPVLINETRDHTARRFVEQVDAGLIPQAGLANAYRIGSVALTWVGARLNNYPTQAPAEALMRVPDPLRSWLESWDTEMAATVTCEDARDLAIRILDEIDRMRANPPKEEDEDNDADQEGDEGDKALRDKTGGSDQDNPSNDPSQGADGDEGSESESGEGGKPKDSGQADSDRGADGDDGKPASGGGEKGDAGDDGGDPKNGAGGASDEGDAGGEQGDTGDDSGDPQNGAGGASDDGDTGGEDANQGDRSGDDGETDESPDGNGGKDSGDEGGRGDSEADDGKGVGSGGDDTDKDPGGGKGDGQSRGGGGDEPGKQGDPGAGADDDDQSSEAAGDEDGSSGAEADGQPSAGDSGPDKGGSAGCGTDEGGQSSGADAEGDADGKGEKDGDPAKDDGDQKEGDADGEESDGRGEEEENASRPTPPPAGGSAGSGSDQDAGNPVSGPMAKDAIESGEAGADGAGPSKPMPQKKTERRDIHVPEGDQNEKAEEADLAIDELIEAINEACQGMAEAETPDIHDPRKVAASKEENGDEDLDDCDVEDGQGVEQHRVKRTGTEKYTMLRQQLSSAAARTAGVVRRMLQSRNRTRTRSGLEDGHLDFSRLVPMAMGSSDVYRQTRSTPQINTALSLLLDNSGSMSGHPLRLCQETAIVLDMSVQGTPTALEILGFTSDSNGTRIYQYRTFEQKGVSSAASLGNMDSVVLGGTPVGTPIMEAWRRLRQRKEPRRIMIVVSDGGAQDPVEALAAARIVEMQGGTIVGIAIGAERYMKQWCEKVVPINNVDELPQALAQIVQEYLSR